MAYIAERQQRLPWATIKRRRWVLGALGILLALGIGAGVGSHAAQAQTPIPTDRPVRVLAVGDSVMEGAATAIPQACENCEVVVDTEVSRSTGTSVEAALGHGGDWDVVVVLLGHNDGASARVYQPAFDRLFDSYAQVGRIVVLTLHEVEPYYRDVNAFLRASADRRPNLRVLDWNAIVDAHPRSVARDGLHLSSEGASLMAGEINQAIAVARFELAPTTTTTSTTAPPATTTVPLSTTTEAAPAATNRGPVVPTPPVAASNRPHPENQQVATPSAPQPHTPTAAAVAVPLVLGLTTAALITADRRQTRRRGRS